MPHALPKVLLIDDHLLFAEGLKAQLVSLTKSENISILNDGSQYVRQLAFAENYDLYIFDLSMPTIDGFDLIRKLIDHSPHAKILIVSAANDHTLADEALKLGAMGFISKASSPEIMREGVQAVLRAEQFFDPNLLNVNRVQSNGSAEGLRIPPRTKEVLKHMINGQTNKGIADLLSISESTVKWHVSRLFILFEVNSRTACVTKATRMGLGSND